MRRGSRFPLRKDRRGDGLQKRSARAWTYSGNSGSRHSGGPAPGSDRSPRGRRDGRPGAIRRGTRSRGRIRYAVVGLGHIAQVAVLPAFSHAENSELVALVSGDRKKLQALGGKYGIERRYDYSQFDDLLRSGGVDAVYIALPNDLHRDFAVRAA